MVCRPYGTRDLGDEEVPTPEVVGYSLSSLRDVEPFAFLSAEGAREDEVFSFLTTRMSRHMRQRPKGQAFQSSGLNLAGD